MAEGGGGPEIQQPVQEIVDPVKEYATAAGNWFELFYHLGLTTRPRLAGATPKPIEPHEQIFQAELDREASTSPINPHGVERSLHTRAERAKLLKGLKSGKINSPEVNKLKFNLDEFDRQFLNQGNISIDIPELGIQGSRYVMIELLSKKEAAESKPPIFLVPALSGDLTGVAPLMREAALQGRRVVVVGYPESFMGKTTETFAQEAQASPSFEPHTTYFKKAIEALLGTTEDIELWGYSTGGGIVTEILNDSKFQQRVANAVIIAPGGSVNQSKMDIVKGVLHEVKEVLRRPKGIQDTAVAYARKLPIEKAHKELRDKIFYSTLFNKVGKEINPWGGIKVKEGGKIVVVTGRKDEITRSYRVNQDLLRLPNSQIALLEFSQGSHLFPLTQAEFVVRKIAEIRDNPQQSRFTRIGRI